MAQLPRDRVTALPWKTYVPTLSDHQGEPDVLHRITHRRALEGSLWSKILIPRPLACDRDAIIPLGSHRLLRKSTGEEFESVQTALLHLAHFPVRSEVQLRTKVITGWQSLQAYPKRKPFQAFQWADLLRCCQDPRPISAEELHQIAMQYAVWKEDPLPVSTVYDPVPTHVRSPQLFDWRLRMPEPFPIQ